MYFIKMGWMEIKKVIVSYNIRRDWKTEYWRLNGKFMHIKVYEKFYSMKITMHFVLNSGSVLLFFYCIDKIEITKNKKI